MKFFSHVWCLFIVLRPQVATDNKLPQIPLQASENGRNFPAVGTESISSDSWFSEHLSFVNGSAIFRNVETLSKVLKKKVEMLRVYEDKKLDIVFLIDSSYSVGEKNFNSELKFVKKLLADFTISLNDTRVAVITFSDNAVRHVDHISVPSEENHKCNMLQYDFNRIHFVGGNTYTLGALVEAQSVLEWSRAGAMKAVFLITDGFSNGGDPEPVANILKNNGTLIFTFGIHSGNIKELQNISSSPFDEFLYLLESFGQFEAVARRALHQDLSVGLFQILKNASLCDSICSDQERGHNGCCDLIARCACGTASGHYSCLCPPSYYGSGLLGSCSPCPNGTYHDGLSPGDELVCVPCPDPNHITLLGFAASKDNCFCKRGFVAKENACKVITCPRLYPPENGYFVKGQGTCLNVFNAACGMRCKAGYALHGTSIRLCQENGTWSGKAPRCIVKMCPNLSTPQHGHITCSRESTESSYALVSGSVEPKSNLTHYHAVDTVCEFSCSAGNVLIGSRRRVCLPLARWDGLKTFCKPVMCPSLPKLAHGFINPEKCTESGKLPFGQVCSISCGNGYQLMGPSFRRCEGKGGHWSMKVKSSKCLDVESPLIVCPEPIEIPTEPGQSFAVVNWPQPLVSDNSGSIPLLWTLPVTTQPMKVLLGVTSIMYIALDASLNQASCTFNITVFDAEPPTKRSCNSPSPVHLVGNNESAFVVWALPEFDDNSGRDISVHSSHQFGEFPLGNTQVKITATDWAGNNSTCLIDIAVRAQPCNLSPPEVHHGTISCISEKNELKCLYFCDEGYSFSTSMSINLNYFHNLGNGSLMFVCSLAESHMTGSPTLEDFPVCSEIIPPNTLSEEGVLYAYSNIDSCNDSNFIEEVKNIIHMSLSKQSMDFCRKIGNMECLILDANASCNERASTLKEDMHVTHRLKRTDSSQRQAKMVKLSKSFPHPSETELLKTTPLIRPHTGKLRRPKRTGNEHSLKIQVTFNVVAELSRTLAKKSNPDSRGFMHTDTFNKLKDSLGKTGIVLPQGVELRGLIWTGITPTVVCEEGSVPIFPGACLKCSAGSFFSNLTQKCHSCPIGQYQENEGQIQCMSCPHGMSTRLKNSRSAKDCQFICTLGSHGPVLGPETHCTSCPPDSYEPNYGATSCVSCPTNFSISSWGSVKSAKKCMKSSQDHSSVFSHCHATLCQNGGSCNQTADGYLICLCPSGFYGSHCELSVNSCDSSPCLHDSLCIPDPSSSYTCSCSSGFKGLNCDEELNECSSNPCYNNASCEDLLNGFYCECPVGFQGVQCEEAIDYCAENPCGLFGRCHNHLTGYKCSCSEGYSGLHCEFLSSESCPHEACSNGASCRSLNHSEYECQCLPHWTGRHCEVLRNGCLSSPCLNNSTCVNKEDSLFFCQCQPSFTGEFCQTRVFSDHILHFPVSSVTDYAIVNFPNVNLSQVTVCLWLQSTDVMNYGTAFSYAVEKETNSLTLTDYNGFVLYVNGEWVITDITANDGEWHHLCVLWQQVGGMWAIYVDGLERSNGSQLSTNKMIKGSGKFVLGQEQDTLGGSFSESESLVGRIYRLNVWNYTLNQITISSLAKECHKSIDGSVVSWADLSSGIRGKIKIENSSFCSDCPAPISLWRGSVGVVHTEMGLSAIYTCEKGFVFHQNKRQKLVRRCLKHGAWEGSNPSCVRRSCGFPGYLPGGTFLGRSFLYTDKITYKCHSGFQIVGNTSRVCEESGKWGGSQPVCKGFQCPAVSPPENGYVDMNETTQMQTASFFCDPGFYLDGTQTLRCMLDGSWDESVPNCLKTKCSLPPHIEYAAARNYSNHTFEYGDEVQYDCKEHYVMNPTEGIIVCSVNGSWVSSKGSLFPVCKPNYCLGPDHLKHGAWTTKEKIETSSLEKYSVSSVIEARCEPDYKVDGPFVKKCHVDGDWLPLDVTQCVKVTCDTEILPYDVPNSYLAIHGEEVGDIVTLSCNDGFHITTGNISNVNVSRGASERNARPSEQVSSYSWICCRNGSWILTDNIDVEDIWFGCIADETQDATTNCSSPRAPAFGYILSNFDADSGSPPGAIVNVRCRPGYVLEGPSSSICHHNGTWTGLASTHCRAVQCLSQPHFLNMIVKTTTGVGSRMEFGNMIIYECFSGFRAQGDLSVRCQANGHWSPMRGSCQHKSSSGEINL